MMSNTAKKVTNLGCRLNISEGNHINAMLAQDPEKYKDVMVVNSCAVTKEATRKSLQTARQLKRANPDKKLIFTGCAAQIAPEKYRNIAEIDAVIGNDKKLQLDSYDNTMPVVSDIFTITETALHLLESYRFNNSRAFMQIQTGCDHRCTFCIIPYGRGNSRSVPAPDIIAQIKQLLDENVTEIVLTGVDLTSYHDAENNRNLGTLVQEILDKVPALPRLRISS
ncbi:MAG: radical SAM protein, partial [Alphaproteobacteria bacterium]|nr:radical SAM protein [Alphaproteobacteria bacterium]